MEQPVYVTPDQWTRIAAVVTYLILFVALGLTAVVAFLMAHAVLPSLENTQHIRVNVALLQRLLTPLWLVAFALTLFVFVRAIALTVEVLEVVFPRFLI